MSSRVPLRLLNTSCLLHHRIGIPSRNRILRTVHLTCKPEEKFPQVNRSSVEMIPIQSGYQLEREVAVAAVLQASIVTRRIFDQLIRPGLQTGDSKASITKVDRSPVTVGDYTVQALVNFILSKYFPNDEIVGEEDTSELLNTTDKKHLQQIIDFTNQGLKEDRLSTTSDEEKWTKFRDQSALNEKELVDLIDLGQSQGGKEGKNRRFWTLDPIDGTKGFLRGGQYAICLALVVDGEVVLGVIGTPNLPLKGITTSTADETVGALFLAEKDSGAFQRPLDSDDYTQIQMAPRNMPDLAKEGTFCESVEAAHSDQHLTVDIAKELGMLNSHDPIRIDSQAKYCVLARGDSDIYLRFPTQADYQEKIWDHAAGNIMLSESGGKVGDLNGKALDFSCGRTLSNNYQGFLACHSQAYPNVLKTVQNIARLHKKIPGDYITPVL
ncbi:3'(2'),5'-bisphosphate nucleotidase [Puccinia striiformis f. sp. tritici PST-78]|uniref:3'(2'),5'-bisphosphate nucleotidase n=2 Tax=Puccinia striiformis f. sp. tritici PST-78 TaxID=1165861 RepID=A0A0L0VT00_9BASI|nr:3'(2'),5'-bisphosphate nucleotidase [Puccinia striiformis f. sp. tritici PST-78]